MTIDMQLLQETERRYEQRHAARAEHQRKMQDGSLLQVDTPERIAKRMQRLAQHTPAKALAVTGTELLGDGVAFERVLGQNDLMSIIYLERGLLVARSVGRVRIRNAAGATRGFGTGSLVSPRLLLTNNHVLGSAQEAANSQIEFNFQERLSGAPVAATVFALDPATFFLTDAALDYTLVAVRPQSLDGVALQDFGWNRLIEEEGKAILGEALNIIQHPNGEPKQLALRENLLVDVLDNFLHYKTDTAPGSSGSPVFNDQWEVVALHHSGVPRRDANGRLLTKDGKLWRPEMGETRIDWIANEGARVSRLLRHLKAQSLASAQAQLRAELLEAVPPTESQTVARSAPAAVAAVAPASLENGVATWTIPLQISVRLGEASLPGGNAPAPSVTAPVVTAPVVPPSPADSPGTDDDELQAALATFREASTKPYYSKTKDAQDAATYYSGLANPQTLSKSAFYQQLGKLVRDTHKNKFPYKPAVHLYPWIDLQPNLKIRSIYSQLEFAPEVIIREDFQIEADRAERLEALRSREANLTEAQLVIEADALEAALPFNCEHVVPQSWFNKKEPMRGDLHHLFACETNCNSFRSNIPYFDFPDFEEAIREDCGKRDDAGTKFEPTGGKGAVARAVLYFLLRYPKEINQTVNEYKAERLETLIKWHKAFPVGRYELHRNAAIFEKQGNRNPLIDHPEWVDEIDFTQGLG